MVDIEDVGWERIGHRLPLFNLATNFIVNKDGEEDGRESGGGGGAYGAKRKEMLGEKEHDGKVIKRIITTTKTRPKQHNEGLGGGADTFYNVKIRSKHAVARLPILAALFNIGDGAGGRVDFENDGSERGRVAKDIYIGKENDAIAFSPSNGNTGDDALSSVLPWRRRVYLRTWGCAHNSSDTEYMAGLLTRAGYALASQPLDADLWLLNSCTVKTPSETQLHNHVKEALAHGARVVVAGCVSQASPNEPWLRGISICGVQQIDRIVEVVDETLKGNVVRLLSAKPRRHVQTQSKLPPLDMPKVRRNAFIEILAINTGCLNFCTYCKTKEARGDLRSHLLDELVERARHALCVEGCKELWLTSEDLGAWGRDHGMVLPDLLNALIEVIPDGCMMRLGMTNPPYILDYLAEIAAILCHPRVYAFLHIPVQSASDAVLGEMKREYTSAQFRRIVDYMLENVPNVYIATDVICAFPTESIEDFEESLALVEQYKFPSLFINQFYPRPGTPAARLKKIDTVEARRRTNRMTHLFRSYTRYSLTRIGGIERVLICEMATDGYHYVGHNKSYEHILVAPPTLSMAVCEEEAARLRSDCSLPSSSLLGKWASVVVTEVDKFYMKAKLVTGDNHAVVVEPLIKPTTTKRKKQKATDDLMEQALRKEGIIQNQTLLSTNGVIQSQRVHANSSFDGEADGGGEEEVSSTNDVIVVRHYLTNLNKVWSSYAFRIAAILIIYYVLKSAIYAHLIDR